MMSCIRNNNATSWLGGGYSISLQNDDVTSCSCGDYSTNVFRMISLPALVVVILSRSSEWWCHFLLLEWWCHFLFLCWLFYQGLQNNDVTSCSCGGYSIKVFKTMMSLPSSLFQWMNQISIANNTVENHSVLPSIFQALARHKAMTYAPIKSQSFITIHHWSSPCLLAVWSI